MKTALIILGVIAVIASADKGNNMTMSHHNDPETMRRFLEQMEGKAKRAYPAGRMGAEDDGQLSYAMATDDRHKTIVIRFGKPVEWIAMSVIEAEQLRDQLTERLLVLRGITKKRRCPICKEPFETEAEMEHHTCQPGGA